MENTFLDVFGVLFLPVLSFRKFMLVETANKESSKDKICHPKDSIGDGIFILGQQIKRETDSRMVRMVRKRRFMLEIIILGKLPANVRGSCVSLVAL